MNIPGVEDNLVAVTTVSGLVGKVIDGPTTVIIRELLQEVVVVGIIRVLNNLNALEVIGNLVDDVLVGLSKLQLQESVDAGLKNFDSTGGLDRTKKENCVSNTSVLVESRTTWRAVGKLRPLLSKRRIAKARRYWR